MPRARALTPIARALGAAARAFAAATSLSLALTSALGCADEAPVKRRPRAASADPEQRQIEEGRAKIREANRAVGEKKYERARALLGEASALNLDTLRSEIEEATGKLDRREAKLRANETWDRLAEKDCMGAVQELGGRMKALASEPFTKELRRLTSTRAQKCVEGALDDKVLAGAYTDARQIATSPDVKAVLGAAAQKKIATQLEDTILDALHGQIADDLKARRWAQAVDKIDAAIKKGDAIDTEGDALLTDVRAGVAKDIIATATRSIGQNDAPKALAQIDALIKLARWEVMTGDAATLAKDRALPEEVSKKREALATWVEAQKVRFTVLKRPEKRWAHGKVAVAPPGDSKAEPQREVAHGAAVWMLGTTKDGRALITAQDPGGSPLTAVLENASGWAPLERLKAEPTIDWVVPDAELPGALVWAPLRNGEPLWELGTVTEVTGKDIAVKRAADDAIVKVTRNQLRSGRLTPGTRVITFCTAKDQPAKIAQVLPTQRVKLKCDSGEEKEEALASLRSKPELLPKSK